MQNDLPGCKPNGTLAATCWAYILSRERALGRLRHATCSLIDVEPFAHKQFNSPPSEHGWELGGLIVNMSINKRT